MEPSVYFEDMRKFMFATLPQRLITNLTPKEALKEGKKLPVPFDLYCESMKDKLENGICEVCGLYWPSAAAKNRHLKAHKIGHIDEKIDSNKVNDEFETDEETMEIEEELSGQMPAFENMRSYLTSPFVTLTDEIEEEL